VFRSKTNKDRDLAVPSEVEADPKAREVLRAWVANGGLVCALRPETWSETSNWGIVLADLARHVANAVHDLKGDEPGWPSDDLFRYRIPHQIVSVNASPRRFQNAKDLVDTASFLSSASIAPRASQSFIGNISSRLRR